MDLLEPLLLSIHLNPLTEPNAYRTQLAHMIAGTIETDVMRDFVRAMENPMPIVAKMKADGVKPEDFSVPFVSIAISAVNQRCDLCKS